MFRNHMKRHEERGETMASLELELNGEEDEQCEFLFPHSRSRVLSHNLEHLQAEGNDVLNPACALSPPAPDCSNTPPQTLQQFVR